MEQKLGVVFSGGGGKGGYEIGVWKAFNEFKFTQHIKAISGTSVGALNSTLLTLNNYQNAEDVWLNISQSQILKTGKRELFRNVYQNIKNRSNLCACLRANNMILESLLLGFFATRDGIFSQRGLKEILEQQINFNQIKEGIPCYCCISNIEACEPEYIKINDCNTKEEMVNYLLASAALPAVFDPVEINGLTYYDGGIIDNTPIRPLIESEDVDVLVIVMLEQAPLSEELEALLKGKKYWKIIPTQNPGGFTDGTLKFSSFHSRKLIDMGYEDTKKVLLQLKEFLISEQRFKQSATLNNQQQKGFKDLVQQKQEIDALFSGNPESSPKLSLSSTAIKPLETQEHSELIAQSKKRTAMISEISNIISEAEKQMIDENVDHLLDEMIDNSEDLSKLAFESISALASTEGRIDYQRNQGFLSRLWGGITGKNQKLNAEISMDQNRAIHANTSMIQKLSERSALTLDAIISVNNKVNYMMLNINRLSLQQQQSVALIQNLAHSVGQVKEYLENRIDQMGDRLDRLEQHDQVHQWFNSVPSRYLEGTQPLKISSIIRDYLEITDSCYQDDSLHLFRSALIQSGIKGGEIISRKTFVTELLSDNQSRSLLSSYTEGVDRYRIPELVSHAESIVNGSNHLHNIVAQYDEADQLPVIDLATELLFTLKKERKTAKSSVDFISFSIKEVGKIVAPYPFASDILRKLSQLETDSKNLKTDLFIVGKECSETKQLLQLLQQQYNHSISFKEIPINHNINQLFTEDGQRLFLIVYDIRFLNDQSVSNIIKTVQEYGAKPIIIPTKLNSKPPSEISKIINYLKDREDVTIIQLDIKAQKLEPLAPYLNQLLNNSTPFKTRYFNEHLKIVVQEILELLKQEIKKQQFIGEDCHTIERDQQKLIHLIDEV